MKSPLWESSPGALVALLTGKSFCYCTLYSIVLFGSQGTIRLCDGDIDVQFNGLNFSSRGPFVDLENSKAAGHWKRGLDVDSWTLAVLPRNVDPVSGAAYPDQIGSSPWIAAARSGALEGADIQVDRAYFAAWPQPYRAVGTPVGVLTIFAGRPAEVDCTDSIVVISISDYRELLLQKLPRNVFGGGCHHTLFDAGCTLNPASFVRTGTLLSPSTRSTLFLSAGVVPALGSGSYLAGKIVFTSGLNSGFSRGITSWSPGALSVGLLNPLPFNVGVGDAFNIYPGCDKQMATCTAFGNLVNFGGEPYTPDATTAI